MAPGSGNGVADPSSRRVAIAGATGFVGRAVGTALRDKGYAAVGLCRTPREDWHRACDLFSLEELGEALAGCTTAVYLVHSMMPSARLTQARFEDLDLVLADNFARAAARCGVRRIVFLGGLVPDVRPLSSHLRSRLEVERTLGAHGIEVVALRAGLVVGPSGSSLRILVNLVRRLPALLTPAWTANRTQPVALRDVVRALVRAVEDEHLPGGPQDIGGPEVMTYRNMLERTARVLGLRRPMLGVPFMSTGLSKLWVSLVSGTPMSLVGPLVDSLRHSMVAEGGELQRWLEPDLEPFSVSLREAAAEPASSPSDRLRAARAAVRPARNVRSVQRLPHPGRSARWVGEEYLRWLPSVPIPGLRCETRGERASFHGPLLRRPLLVLERVATEDDDLAAFQVVGGLLARVAGDGPPGQLEFRSVLDGQHVLAALHHFRPRLPWRLYRLTQARVHLWVMRAFGRHLGRLAGDRVAKG